VSDPEERLDKVIADWKKRTLASLPIEEVAEMYRRMKAEQAAAEAEPRSRGLRRIWRDGEEGMT